MRTNHEQCRRLRRLAKLVNTTVADAVLNLIFESRQVEADQLREDGKNFVFALLDARNVLKRKGVQQ